MWCKGFQEKVKKKQKPVPKSGTKMWTPEEKIRMQQANSKKK